MLWPAIAAGSTPSEIHHWASAYSMAKSAGCVSQVWFKLLRRGLLFRVRRIECGNEIDAQRLAQMARAEIESVAEDRLVLVKFAAHVHVLRALAGEEKDGRGARSNAGDEFFRVRCR